MLALALVGRLVPVKDHAFFLQAVAHVKKASKKCFQVFLVGDGEEKQALMELCGGLNLSYNTKPDPRADVIFTSWIAEIDVVFAGIDLVCLSSKNEGTPVSLIEAGCAGKPFLATDVGGIRDILLDPSQGTITPKGNLNAFNEALLAWVDSANPAEALDDSIRHHIAEKYSYKQLCSTMSKVYKELLAP